MKVNIILAYRPLSRGGNTTPNQDIRQLPDGRWSDDDGQYRFSGDHRYHGGDDVVRTIKILNKNSHFKHNIIVAIDSDVYPNETFLKEFDNVTVFKSKYLHKEDLAVAPSFRTNAAMYEAIHSIPDEEWLCYAYASDLICCRDWDKRVIEAIQTHGDEYIYVPMFTEVRGDMGNVVLKGIEPTPDLIWNEWRRTVCCHALTMPQPACGYFTETDMDNFIRIASAPVKPVYIVERPGDRIYGYYAILFMKAKYAKKAIRMIGPGFDTDFDNRLYSVCRLMKIVVTNSFVFHPFCEFKSEDPELNARN